MSKFSLHAACAAVALASLSPTVAFAQNNSSATTTNVEAAMNTAADPGLNTMDPAAADPYAPATAPANDDDKDFPWGLLGLLGLAGLLGLKRRDDDHVRVDRTTDTTNKRM